MIAVVADDLTGAAELAGISLRYGLRVELCTGKPSATEADVLIVSTDSRSMSKTDAIRVTKEVWRQVLALQPAWVYKKIDSVLRGYVLEELEVQMQLMQMDRAFILPANPSLGRTISHGKYYIQGKPISETGFATDPEFPLTDSSIQALLKTKSVMVLKTNAILPDTGMLVGEAVDEKEVAAWAARVDDSFVLAGAGDFFAAMLKLRFSRKEPARFQLRLPLLYVCGTAYDKSVDYVRQVGEQLDVVMYITRKMLDGEADSEWLAACGRKLAGQQKCIIAFDKAVIGEEFTASVLRTIMAQAIASVIKSYHIKELFIDGGSTATAVLQELAISHLSPENEWQRGVVRMKAGDLHLTVKPGSYSLPDELIQLFSN